MAGPLQQEYTYNVKLCIDKESDRWHVIASVETSDALGAVVTSLAKYLASDANEIRIVRVYRFTDS